MRRVPVANMHQLCAGYCELASLSRREGGGGRLLIIPSSSAAHLLSMVLLGSEVIVCRGKFGQGRKMKKSKLLMEIFALYIL